MTKHIKSDFLDVKRGPWTGLSHDKYLIKMFISFMMFNSAVFSKEQQGQTNKVWWPHVLYIFDQGSSILKDPFEKIFNSQIILELRDANLVLRFAGLQRNELMRAACNERRRRAHQQTADVTVGNTKKNEFADLVKSKIFQLLRFFFTSTFLNPALICRFTKC